jgi:hypothetical protein
MTISGVCLRKGIITATKTVLDVSDLVGGVYFLQLVGANKFGGRLIVIE